jgi:hypothetical protein
MPDITGGSSGGASADLLASKVVVQIEGNNKDLDSKLKDSESKLSKWTGSVKASFEQSAGAARALGTGIASAVASGSTDLKSLTMQVVGSLGPWGMLASGVLAVGSALGEMIAKGKEAISTLDKVRKAQFETGEVDRKKADMDIIGEFQKVATKEQRAEFTRMEKWGAPSDKKQREEYISAASVGFARQTMETLKRESQSVYGMVAGQISDAIVEAVATAAPRLKLNFQNDNNNTILGGGAMVGGALAALDLDASRQGSTAFATAFQGLKASAEGMQAMNGKAASAGGFYSSDQTYAGKLGDIGERQLQSLEGIEQAVNLMAGKEAVWGN